MGRLAAVDVGSTSVHLLVADMDQGSIAPVADESVFAGLGEAVGARGMLGDAAAAELASVLAAYARRATDLRADDVVVLATAPLRRAADAARVVWLVGRDAGVALHALTEREEALLTLLGATGGVAPADGIALVDVGGGSTELVAMGSGGAPLVTALPIGAATLAGRHVTGDPPLAHELASMRAEALASVSTSGQPVGGTVVAVGGTADNLARVSGSRHLSRGRVEAALARLGTMTADEAAAAFGIRAARSRLLPAGAVILLAVMDRWRVDAVEVSPAGLREGAVLARAGAGRCWRDRLEALVAPGR